MNDLIIIIDCIKFMKNPNFHPFPTLITKRLRLRKLEEKDVDLIYNYQCNKKNFPFVDMPVYDEVAQAKDYIIKMNTGVDNDKWIIWAIADIKSDTILGTISIWNFNSELNMGELGYGLFPKYLGSGLMSEALSKVVEFGFDTLELASIEAYTNEKNKKSVSLLKRNYFTFVKKVKEKSVIMSVFSINQ